MVLKKTSSTEPRLDGSYVLLQKNCLSKDILLIVMLISKGSFSIWLPNKGVGSASVLCLVSACVWFDCFC